MHNGSSIMVLIKELKQQAKTFIRDEIQLAKVEMSRKIGSYGASATSVAIGGFLAYAGLIVFLGGLGALLAYAFSRLGLDPLLAAFIGLAIIGLLVFVAGALMLLKGVQAVKKVSPKPERTIRTLQQLKGSGPATTAKPLPEMKDDRPPEEIEAGIIATQARMADTMDALADRVTLSRARRRANAELRAHPYRWGLVAAGCGAAGSYLVKRKLQKSVAR
jgi:hypothetical protein